MYAENIQVVIRCFTDPIEFTYHFYSFVFNSKNYQKEFEETIKGVVM